MHDCTTVCHGEVQERTLFTFKSTLTNIPSIDHALSLIINCAYPMRLFPMSSLKIRMADEMDQTWRENLNCPLCLDVFRDPKILDCSHTFCKICVDCLQKTQPGGDNMMIKCPVCRQVTRVPKGDVGQIKGNLVVKSLIEDMHKRGQACTACASDEKPDAASFCADCGDFFCEPCQDAHSRLVRFSGHALIAASDPSAGKISTKKRRKCHTHPTEDEDSFCTDCCKYVCFKCAVYKHSKVEHDVVPAEEHENKLKKDAREISAKRATKNDKLNKYIDCVIEQRRRLGTVRKQLKDDARKTLQDAIKTLHEKHGKVEGDIDEQIDHLDEMLQRMEADSHSKIADADTMDGIITHSAQAPLELNALEVHCTVRGNLKELVSCPDPDETQPKAIALAGEALRFYSDEGLGKLEMGVSARWDLVAETPLPVKDNMNAMASAPDGLMAVGCCKGGKGLLKFDANGELKESDLTDVNVFGVSFMSDGRLLVLDTSNKITLHSSSGNISSFETLNRDVGGFGNITVDSDDKIYCSYRKAKEIHVFDSSGGKPVREISCQKYEPMQIFAMKARKMLVVRSHIHEVRTIDSSSGATVDTITQADMLAHPAVCQDDSIIIAWVNHKEGLVSIDHYTSELRRIRNLVTNHKITKPARDWYYFQQFKSGEMAFCSSDILYIFRMIHSFAQS